MRYSLGALIGIPVTALILFICVGVFWYVASKPTRNNDSYERTDRLIVKSISAGVFALTVVIFAFSWWPFSWEYHQWRPVSGTVASIDKRMIGTGEAGLGEVYLIKFKDSDQPYRCDDTRCAGVEPGDTLHLSCIRDWQYASEHGYSCRFGGY